jgi:DNA polymerase-4
MGLGMDDDPVEPMKPPEEGEAKSMGHSMTLDEDCSDTGMIERHILQLSEKVGRRLRRGLYSGRTVSLILRYADFHTFSKQHRLRHAVSHGLDLYTAARGILQEIELLQPVRLVGVSVSSLERNMVQIPLFMDEQKRKFALEAMDVINDRYGEFTVTWGTLIERYRHARVISPAWRPTGDRRY